MLFVHIAHRTSSFSSFFIYFFHFPIDIQKFIWYIKGAKSKGEKKEKKLQEKHQKKDEGVSKFS
jgi:hypothetical protein